MRERRQPRGRRRQRCAASGHAQAVPGRSTAAIHGRRRSGPRTPPPALRASDTWGFLSVRGRSGSSLAGCRPHGRGRQAMCPESPVDMHSEPHRRPKARRAPPGMARALTKGRNAELGRLWGSLRAWWCGRLAALRRLARESPLRRRRALPASRTAKLSACLREIQDTRDVFTASRRWECPLRPPTRVRNGGDYRVRKQ